eukprot:4193205-Prymnesium_polylepis.1
MLKNAAPWGQPRPAAPAEQRRVGVAPPTRPCLRGLLEYDSPPLLARCTMALRFDAECGSQLAEEQPRNSPRRAERRARSRGVRDCSAAAARWIHCARR